jgi:hypothetical protein
MESLHPDRDRAAVEAQIRAAFAGVTPSKGMSLRQAQVADPRSLLIVMNAEESVYRVAERSTIPQACHTYKPVPAPPTVAGAGPATERSVESEIVTDKRRI